MRQMEHRRGQAYALEGIIAAVIVLTGLVLGLQAVDIAPWTGENEQAVGDVRTQMADTLDAAQDTDALRTIATCVGSDGDPAPGVASTDEPTTEFGKVLANTTGETYSYRILVDYNTSSGVKTADVDATASLPAQPTATVTRQVALFDSDIVYEDAECRPRISGDGDPARLEEEGGDIYLEDQHPNSELFTVVQIRVTAW